MRKKEFDQKKNKNKKEFNYKNNRKRNQYNKNIKGNYEKLFISD